MAQIIGMIVVLVLTLTLLAVAIPVALAGVLMWIAIIPEFLGVFGWFMSCEWLDFSVLQGFCLGFSIWILLALVRNAVFSKL